MECNQGWSEGKLTLQFFRWRLGAGCHNDGVILQELRLPGQGEGLLEIEFESPFHFVILQNVVPGVDKVLVGIRRV